MRVLLVEPNYKNKYPPLGLMKISQYHKQRGDYVLFYKGKYDYGNKWDRIYITTLFTFDFKKIVDTINFYKTQVNNIDDIYVGGILASLLTDKLKESTGIKNIIQGRLTSSSMLNFNDDVNIDTLPLDYNILYDIDYIYPSGDNFFGYITRGCVNKCEFCAVPKLEGNLCAENNIVNQINEIRHLYGDKRNLLLLDNNILGLNPNELQNVVNDLNSLGFIKTPSFRRPLQLDILANCYYRMCNNNNVPRNILTKLYEYPQSLLKKKISKEYKHEINSLLNDVGEKYDDVIDCVLKNYEFFRRVEEKYIYKNLIQRYIDFNQGLDARQLTEEKMQIISALPIRPFRIAYDDIKYTKIYVNAIRLANKYDAPEFSNYLLYNNNDKPEDLYLRLKINVILEEQIGKHIYSFPMCYEPIYNTSRKHIGKYWNMHYLRSIKAILNVTKGVFSGNRSFFEKAFGTNIRDFYRIISMPKDLITYRNFYEDNGITAKWTRLYYSLSKSDLSQLMSLVSECIYETDNPNLKEIIKFYKISYKNN